MQRRAETGTVTVPVPDHRELKTGTLVSISGRAACPGLSSSPDLWISRTASADILMQTVRGLSRFLRLGSTHRVIE